VREAFKDLFFSMVQQHCGTFSPIRIPVAGLRSAGEFYQAMLPLKRYTFMKDLLERQPYIYSALLDNFAQSWSNSLLHTLVTEACEAIVKGEVVSSLVGVVRSHMRWLLAPLVVLLLQRLWSFWALDGVAALGATDKTREGEIVRAEKVLIVKDVLATIRAPPLKELLSAVDGEPLMVLPRFFPGERRAVASSLVLYDAIADQIQKMLDKALAQLTRNKRAPNDTLVRLKELVKADKDEGGTLWHIVERIQSNRDLYSLFRNDFVLRTLRLPFLKSPWVELCGDVLESLSLGLPDCDGQTLLGLFVIKHFDHAKLAYLNICLLPLQLLEDPPLEEPLLHAVPRFASVKEIEGFIAAVTINILWDRLAELMGQKGKDVDKMMNWCQVFRSLRSRIGGKWQIRSMLEQYAGQHGQSHSTRFDIMLGIFLYALNLSVNSAELLKDLAHADVKDIITQLLKEDQRGEEQGEKEPGERKEGGLIGVMGLVAALVQAYRTRLREEKQPSDKEQHDVMHLVQDVVIAMLHEDQNNPLHLPELLEDWQIFFSLTNQAQLLPRIQARKDAEQITALWKLLRREWQNSFLYSWLKERGRPLEWYNRLCDVLGEVTDAVLPPAQDEAYLFHPTWKSGVQGEQKEKAQDREHMVMEDMLYHVHLKEYRDETLLELCTGYRQVGEVLAQPDSNKLQRTATQIALRIRLAALGVLILQKAAQNLSATEAADPVASIRAWPSQPVPILEIVKGLLVGGGDAPTNRKPLFFEDGDLYFLSHFNVGKGLITLLGSQEALNLLGLEKWFIGQGVSAPNYCLFSFMLEGQSELGRGYQAFKAQVAGGNVENFMAYVNGEVAKGERARNCLRMFVILVCYYEYFSKGQACALVQQQLNTGLAALLDINAEEIDIYQLLSNAPQPAGGSQDIDGLQYMFSQEAFAPNQQVKFDSTLTNLMVNNLAVAVGSPRESNHIYPR